MTGQNASRSCARLVLFACCAAGSGCAGYQLGNATLFRPEIRTVHVPMFESDSFRRGLSEWLTEAVVKQIERESPYKVVADPALADTILTGRVLAERKRILAETKYDDPRDVDMEIVVQVQWVDRRGESIFPSTTFTLAQQGYNVTQNADYIPEAGQSVTSAMQEIIEKTARQIVAQMEAAW